eukprot:6270022-Prymnesium_polylepis.1
MQAHAASRPMCVLPECLMEMVASLSVSWYAPDATNIHAWNTLSALCIAALYTSVVLPDSADTFRVSLILLARLLSFDAELYFIQQSCWFAIRMRPRLPRSAPRHAPLVDVSVALHALYEGSHHRGEQLPVSVWLDSDESTPLKDVLLLVSNEHGVDVVTPDVHRARGVGRRVVIRRLGYAVGGVDEPARPRCVLQTLPELGDDLGSQFVASLVRQHERQKRRETECPRAAGAV